MAKELKSLSKVNGFEGKQSLGKLRMLRTKMARVEKKKINRNLFIFFMSRIRAQIQFEAVKRLIL